MKTDSQSQTLHGMLYFHWQARTRSRQKGNEVWRDPFEFDLAIQISPIKSEEFAYAHLR